MFGYEGREARVSCPYDVGYESYEKYLCKNNCGDEDVLITTTQGKKNRYSIHDDTGGRVFTATISDLSHADAGKYWCGVTRTGKDIYTEVKLDVKQDTCCDGSIKVQSYETGSVSFNCPYEPADQNSLKYICRGNQPSTCLQQAAITSENQRIGRLRLTDDKRLKQFTVNITNLTKEDSGLYLCGVQRNSGLDAFSAVELEVKEWCCVKSSTLSGIVGHPLTMQCPHPPQHQNNRKFLCKGDNRNNCVDMVTSQSRFRLQDDASLGSFTVTITELKTEDAGTYWCGSDSQWSPANYTKIQLSVVLTRQASTMMPPNTVMEPDGSQSTHIPGKPIKDATLFHAVVFTVPAVLLVLTFALVIVCKYKCHKVRGAEVSTNRDKTKAAKEEEMTDVTDVYANQVVVVSSQQRTSKQQGTYDHYDDAGDDPDSVYQNYATGDDIYCNEFKVKGTA